MDPRLWELLKAEPGVLYIREAKFVPKGSQLSLDCEYINNTHPRGRSFELTFKHCRDIRWQVMDPTTNAEAVEALGLYLGEQSHTKPAVVYTGVTEVMVLYSELSINAD